MKKKYIFFHMCATCSELPCNVGTMELPLCETETGNDFTNFNNLRSNYPRLMEIMSFTHARANVCMGVCVCVCVREREV